MVQYSKCTYGYKFSNETNPNALGYIFLAKSCKYRGILLFKQFWVKCGIFHKSNKNSTLPCLIRIYLNWKVISTGTIWVLNNFWKIFGGHDICKMVMKFLLIINFQCIFIIFHSWMPPKLLNWENYRLSIGIFGNLISKCNRLIKASTLQHIRFCGCYGGGGT